MNTSLIKNKSIEIINLGIGIDEEIISGNSSILDTNNSAFMCGCTFDVACDGYVFRINF